MGNLLVAVVVLTGNLTLIGLWVVWLGILWYTQMNMKDLKPFDPFDILGVEHSASDREIRKAYYKLSKEYHPDKVRVETRLDSTCHRNSSRVANGLSQLLEWIRTEGMLRGGSIAFPIEGGRGGAGVSFKWLESGQSAAAACHQRAMGGADSGHLLQGMHQS